MQPSGLELLYVAKHHVLQRTVTEVQDVSEKNGREIIQMGQIPEWVFWVFIGKPDSDHCRTKLTALFLSNWSINSIIKTIPKWWFSHLNNGYGESREWEKYCTFYATIPFVPSFFSLPKYILTHLLKYDTEYFFCRDSNISISASHFLHTTELAANQIIFSLDWNKADRGCQVQMIRVRLLLILKY